MRAHLFVLTGSRSGALLECSRDEILVGRHPSAHVRFHPEHDLLVSACHAVITRRGDRWFLRDLESRNGTFLNGNRVRAEVELLGDDRIAFGAQGPVVEFRVAPTGQVERMLAGGAVRDGERGGGAGPGAGASAAAPAEAGSASRAAGSASDRNEERGGAGTGSGSGISGGAQGSRGAGAGGDPMVGAGLTPPGSSPDGGRGALPVGGNSAGDAESPPRARAAGRAEPNVVAPAGSATERIRIGVARETRGLRRLAGALAVLLLATVAGAIFLRTQEQDRWRRERAEMQAQVHRILAASDTAVRSLEGEVSGLSSALRQTQDDLRLARQALEEARTGGDPEQVRVLEGRLQETIRTAQRQQGAARLDFRGIQRQSRPAVALVFVEMAGGEVSTGTAFAVRPDGTLVTNRHVVSGPDGQAARRVAVQFADSRQIWTARVLRVSPDADLAVLKVDDVLGAVPIIGEFNLRPDTLRPGSPVMVLGFAGGGESGGKGGVVRPLLSAGVVHSTDRERMVVHGYGSAGASGSPVLDATGAVVAVAFGGQPGAAPPTLLAVPAGAVRRLLNGLP